MAVTTLTKLASKAGDSITQTWTMLHFHFRLTVIEDFFAHIINANWWQRHKMCTCVKTLPDLTS